jgi:hypothetical protein
MIVSINVVWRIKWGTIRKSSSKRNGVQRRSSQGTTSDADGRHGGRGRGSPRRAKAKSGEEKERKKTRKLSSKDGAALQGRSGSKKSTAGYVGDASGRRTANSSDEEMGSAHERTASGDSSDSEDELQLLHDVAPMAIDIVDHDKRGAKRKGSRSDADDILTDSDKKRKKKSKEPTPLSPLPSELTPLLDELREAVSKGKSLSVGQFVDDVLVASYSCGLVCSDV